MNVKSSANSEWVFTPDIFSSHILDDASLLSSSSELFKLIVDIIQDGISVLDPTLTIKYANTAMNHWYSTDSEPDSEKCYKRYHGLSTPCEVCPCIKVLETKKPQMEVVRYQLDNKDLGWQQLFAIPLLNRDNEIILIIEYVRDITLRKIAEDNFRDLEQQKNLLVDTLKNREHSKYELEKIIINNIERYVKPSLNYLKKVVKEEDIHMVTGIIDEIIFPLTKTRPSQIITLTPRELQVASLIKQDCPSKQIADRLCITKKAVDYHRANIRKKLQLKREDNLQVYLETHL
ncbi:regulatory LuxR family protein [Ruminiclostridium sufflavum DSM 19573]|uniref:Regulatory LuxR family protein n=1 Tax=Ruminiclostridium sufflavum DSM 19573 TaxID=1121337 RepID=A0A318XQK7_9FIRM|nr:helix-turn-helix transcriptional regulator [Ruminiclostridium sufflavum]PYG90385.1 regulatory LuxR family protein [Ruminiclostridium sufflavum DSM 19573]